MTTFPDLKQVPHGYEGRTGARLAAIQALFQIEQSNNRSTDVVLEFLEHRLNQDNSTIDLDHDNITIPIDKNFFSTLVRGAVQEQDIIDEMITSCLAQGWALDRIESVIRSILRVAAFELKELKSIPAAVIINEYIDLTKSFYETKEASFVNGILDQLTKILRKGTDPRLPVKEDQ